MKKIFTCGLLLLFFLGFSQDDNRFERYRQVPAQFQSHPELGKTNYASVLNQVDYELIQHRTAYSRTFLNTNTTKTTVQSSVPLHYKDADGLWRTIDYRLTRTAGKIVYPAQEPFFECDASGSRIVVGDKTIGMEGKSRFIFMANGAEVSKKTAAKTSPEMTTGNKIVFSNIAPHLDKVMTVYAQAVKSDYKINDSAFFPGQFDQMIVEETIALPDGFSMSEEKGANRIVIHDANGQPVMVFQQPIVTDAKPVSEKYRHFSTPYEATYRLVKVTDRQYKIQIQIEGSWLSAPDRVFPITVDPVVTVSNTDVIDSCFFPSYQQAPLQVAVPAGETVFSTNISYDFVALEASVAWMSDQRSYVSGPNGQTAVLAGVGNTEGTYTYNITNSEIGNVTSTGQVDYVFHFARNWGGSGCNATFNFVNRREVAVTYGTIEFGDGPLVINEYSASNRNFNDAFDRNEDWIELYNASPDTYFNLAGYYLSNNENNPTKWQIQSGVVPPNSKVFVFCSGRNISSGTVLHANFDLTQTDGDEVVLADPSGNIVESHEMFVTQTNHSYGRATDGASEWKVFATPTPGQPNANGAANYATKPTFSLAPGRYPGAVTVSLSTTGANEQIRYTTNGATPTAGATLYTGPISVTQSTVIRARCFSSSPDILPGFIETNTYFINENSTLPTVSVSGDANLLQLLNGTILEPTGYFEYFETNGTFIDETMGDFDAHGNDSWAYNQRGIDFVARDDHGYKRRLQHQFFPTSDRTNFRRLILKAAGSDNFPGQTGGAHMRDVFVQTLSQTANLELDERRARFVSLFVNGQYWGIYDLREKVDDNQYTDYYYGQDYIYRDSDNYIQYLKTWGGTEAEFGNQPALDAWTALTDFVQNNDMADEANYNYVVGQLNIDSLIDYFVLNSFMVNRDWLNWNTSWWRGLDPSGGALKWRYALWDTDGVLGHYINYTGIEDTSANADPCQAETIPVGVGHTQTIGKLIEENPVARQKYVTRYADLLNTHFSCEQVTAVFDSIVAVIAPEIPRQVQRWGGNVAGWQANVQAARDFLLTRCGETVSSGLVDCYQVSGPFDVTFEVEPVNTGKIKMNSEWLVNFPYTAQVFGDIETYLSAEANAGWEFSSWEVDGAEISPNAQVADIMLLISQATSIIAHFKQSPTGGETAIHYWHFNTLDTPSDVTSIVADNTLIVGANPTMTYTGSGPRDIDANSNGSDLNLHFDQSAGKCARVRNPSDGRSLVFDLPTTGYKDIKFAYAVQRTNEGQLTNHLSYSTDGVTFTEAGLAQSAFNVDLAFGLVSVDLSAITAVNNNPDFKIKITFEGNTSADNGNNRIDNVTLKGTPFTLSTPTQNLITYQVYPNPVSSTVHVVCSAPMTELSVFDMVGKRVATKSIDNANAASADLSMLGAGVYLLKIKTENGMVTEKLVKQ
ncbi:LTD domain-containing protein [Flavobacterium longum]|uniref:CotH kinase family protein n=1 Tax=Flavobacterium longum TaxID=1299340 RepID=UPI0039EA6C86